MSSNLYDISTREKYKSVLKRNFYVTVPYKINHAAKNSCIIITNYT